MKQRPFDIISCKTCKFCKIRKVDEHSTIYSCNKDNTVDIDRYELYCNKPCYSKQIFKRNNKKTK